MVEMSSGPPSPQSAQRRIEELRRTVHAEAGTAWHSRAGWTPALSAEATLERVVLAVNDHPISLVLGARHDSATGETLARIGIRIAIVQHPDPRVSLDALGR
jgi:hypothetical protein